MEYFQAGNVIFSLV